MASLRRADRAIEVFADEEIALANRVDEDIDVLIVVPPERLLWKEQLRNTYGAIKVWRNRPALLCVLRWAPQGPADRLFGDSLSMEVQHEY